MYAIVPAETIQPLEQQAGPLGPILVAPVAAPVAMPTSPFKSGLKKLMPGAQQHMARGCLVANKIQHVLHLMARIMKSPCRRINKRLYKK